MNKIRGLNSVMAVLVKSQGSNLVITRKETTPQFDRYFVIVPEGHKVTELELVTRLDNKTLDLANDAIGQPQHFGGDAVCSGPAAGGTEFIVRVYTR
jgi:hypothetical protein